MEANRPEKPVRPELNDKLKAKVDALQTKRGEMRDAHKALRENLKEASKEDRKEMITAYREENKAKHQEIKTQAQEVKEEIEAWSKRKQHVLLICNLIADNLYMQIIERGGLGDHRFTSYFTLI